MNKKIFGIGMGIIITVMLVAIIISMLPKQTKALDPKVLIVSSTQYIPFEQGQIIARFLDWEFSPINTSCWATILYPAKNLFVSKQMTAQTQLENYFITFTVPETIGIYEYSVTCDVNGKNVSGSKAFSVTSIANAIINFTNETLIGITDTINNQTIWLNDTYNDQNTLITNLTNRNFNISEDIYNFITTNLTGINLSINTTDVTNLINTQIGTETNESVKSLLLQIKEKLGFIVTNITINATAPEYVHIGELWELKAFVYNQVGNKVGNLDVTCNTMSNYFNETVMFFIGADTSWNYNFVPITSGVINYEIECEII